MGKYIVKRILQVIPMLFILSLIVFMMVRLIPGDPVDMMLGMDIPKDTKEYGRLSSKCNTEKDLKRGAPA